MITGCSFHVGAEPGNEDKLYVHVHLHNVPTFGTFVLVCDWLYGNDLDTYTVVHSAQQKLQQFLHNPSVWLSTQALILKCTISR